MLVLRFDEFTFLCFQDAKFNLPPDRAGTCFLHHHVCSFLTLSPHLCSTPAACMCEPASAVSNTCCWKKGERKRGVPQHPQTTGPRCACRHPKPLHQLSTRWHEQAAVSLRLSKPYGLHGVIFLPPPFFFFWKRLLSSMMN